MGGSVKKKTHVASFFHRDLAIDCDYRAFDQVCQVSVIVAASPPQARPPGESEIEADPRTLCGRALPHAKPLFAFCVLCSHKANADWAGATASAMDA